MSYQRKFFKFLTGLLLLITLSGSVLTAYAAVTPQGEDPPVTEPTGDVPREVETRTEVIDEHQTTIYHIFEDGSIVEQDIVNGPSEPPMGYEELASTRVEIPDEATVISGFPSYSWVFGCSAVAGAMVAGYWDRHGFPNMYSGPTNGGLMPLSDTPWKTWVDSEPKTYPNNPLIASHKGVDGRTTRGSIDDYWIKSGSTANDPYITGGWTQHTWGSAIGDYMKTSQSKYGNSDASTMLHQYSSGAKMTCADMVSLGYASNDGTYGRKLFYQKRGYTVTECYNQATDNYATSGGFTLADFKAEIDAGNPVFISIVGHSMVGYGYNGSTIYIRNTWDNNPSNTYSMVWGGSYSGREMKGARIVKFKKTTPTLIPTPLLPNGATTTHNPAYKWTKAANAIYYNIELYNFDGTKKLANNVVSSQVVCGPTNCVFKPPKQFLGDGNYKWRVRAKIGGVWKPFSKYKAFNVATDFHYDFSQVSDLKLWRTIVGKWTLNNGWYRSSGIQPYWNSVSHFGYYPKFKYIVTMQRVNEQIGANRITVRGIPLPLSSNKNWHSYYSFQYCNAGTFSVWRRVNGISTELKAWTSTPAINKNGWNTLKVIGVGPSLKYYINNQLVWSGNDSYISTGRVGVGFYKDDSPSWQPLLVNGAHMYTNFTSSSEADVWAEMGETNTDWDNEFESPPVP